MGVMGERWGGGRGTAPVQVPHPLDCVCTWLNRTVKAQFRVYDVSVQLTTLSNRSSPITHFWEHI